MEGPSLEELLSGAPTMPAGAAVPGAAKNQKDEGKSTKPVEEKEEENVRAVLVEYEF